MTLNTAAASEPPVAFLRERPTQSPGHTHPVRTVLQQPLIPVAADKEAFAQAPIVYLVNQYPAVSHTFIRREILALEGLGFTIDRVALRRGQGIVDPVDQAEERKTTYLLKSKLALLKSAMMGAFARPLGFCKALGLAARMCWRSDRGPDKHLIYLIEACALARHIQHCGARHLHAHFGTNSAEVAMLAAAVAGIDYSLTIHGSEEYDRPEYLGLTLKMRRALFVATVSHYGRAQLMRWCADGDESKIVLVRCGLDQEGNRPAPMPEVVPARFVSVARFCRLKGHATLLDAFAELTKRGHAAELVLVGEGETRGAIEQQIADLALGAHVRITGWLDNAAVRREIEASRALVVSSYAENLPVVIMEAFVYGRTVIASAIAGIPELVIHAENGWLVPASSVQALANAMEECLRLPKNALEQRAARGLERVRSMHDVHAEAQKLARLFPTEVQPRDPHLTSTPDIPAEALALP
jgi:colanic acid/amylovoran biosynthesis glycosyltransferase